MKSRVKPHVVVLITLAALGYCGYELHYKFFILPRQDQEFLASHPNRATVLKRFGDPTEELQSGSRFPMTGWHPLPEQAVNYSALSFVRRYGSKLYIFFDSSGDAEHFVISRS